MQTHAKNEKCYTEMLQCFFCVGSLDRRGLYAVRLSCAKVALSAKPLTACLLPSMSACSKAKSKAFICAAKSILKIFAESVKSIPTAQVTAYQCKAFYNSAKARVAPSTAESYVHCPFVL